MPRGRYSQPYSLADRSVATLATSLLQQVIVVLLQIRYSFKLSTALAILLFVNPCLHPLIYATRYDVFKQAWSAIKHRTRAIFPQRSSHVNNE